MRLHAGRKIKRPAKLQAAESDQKMPDHCLFEPWKRWDQKSGASQTARSDLYQIRGYVCSIMTMCFQDTMLCRLLMIHS